MAQISIIIRHPMVRLRRPFIKPGIWDRLLFVLHYTWDPFFVDQLCAAAQQAYYSSSIIFVNQLISSGRKLFEVVNQMVCLPLLWNIVFEIICKRNARVSVIWTWQQKGSFFWKSIKMGGPYPYLTRPIFSGKIHIPFPMKIARSHHQKTGFFDFISSCILGLKTCSDKLKHAWFCTSGV